MKVILTSKIKTLGNIGDIKDVADGYGKNYLLPKKMAIIYSKKNYESFEKQKALMEKLDAEAYEKAVALKNKLENKEIVILENAGDNERLYGSINSLRIAKFINQMVKADEFKKSDVKIATPIRYLGKYDVMLEPHPDTSFKIFVIVARTKEEAEKIKRDAKKKPAPKDENKEDSSKETVNNSVENASTSVEETKTETEE